MISDNILNRISGYHDWHMHTQYTDGKNTVWDMAAKAEALSLDSIAITEHVRQTLLYDIDDLISDIYDARSKLKIDIFIGCEVKVLDESGKLDVSEEVVEKCDFVLAAFHKFPVNKSQYFTAILAMLENPVTDIWAHPFRFTLRNQIKFSTSELKQIFQSLAQNKIVFEINARYPPSEEVSNYIRKYGVKYCFGSDAHDSNHLLSYNFFESWNNKLS